MLEESIKSTKMADCFDKFVIFYHRLIGNSDSETIKLRSVRADARRKSLMNGIKTMMSSQEQRVPTPNPIGHRRRAHNTYRKFQQLQKQQNDMYKARSSQQGMGLCLKRHRAINGKLHA